MLADAELVVGDFTGALAMDLEAVRAAVQMPQVLLSPPGAGATGPAQFNIVGQIVANITAVLRGEPVTNVLDGLDPVIRRH